MFGSLLGSGPELIDGRMREALVRLAGDVVVNVRIKVATLISGFFQGGQKNDFCDDLLAVLAKDVARDVLILVEKAVVFRNQGKKDWKSPSKTNF